MKADLVLQQLPERVRQWLILFGLAAGLAFSIIICIPSFKMALISFKVGALAMYPTETLLGYPQLILGIGLALLSLQIVIEIIRQIRVLIQIYK